MNRPASSFGQLVSSGRGSEWIGRADGLSGRSYRSDNTERVETVSQASAAAPEIASEQNHLQRAVFEKNKCPDKSQLQKPLEKYQDRDYN